MEKTIQFVYDKETPGTHRYREVGADGRDIAKNDQFIATIYLKKALFNGSAVPASLTLTVGWNTPATKAKKPSRVKK